jgi:hypothetical protein
MHGVPAKSLSSKSKAMFSRYNVMNTERTQTAMVKGGEYVAQRISSAK